MPNYDHIDDNLHSYVSVTQFRRNLAGYIATVRFGDDFVCIQRKGRDPVYLISEADFAVLSKRRGYARRPSKTEVQQRSGFWRRIWAGRKARASEPPGPEAHGSNERLASREETAAKIDSAIARLERLQD